MRSFLSTLVHPMELGMFLKSLGNSFGRDNSFQAVEGVTTENDSSAANQV